MSISIDDPIRLASASEAWRPDSYSPPSLAASTLEADIELALQQAAALIQELGKAHSALGASRVEAVHHSLARVGRGTSALAAAVRRLSAPRSRFGAPAFLDAIESAYRCLTNANPGPARVVRLVDVWELLTLRPGSRSEYSKAEFGRDLNLLDESGVTVTSAGRVIRFLASSGTRTDSALTTIGRDGRPHVYWGVSFS